MANLNNYPLVTEYVAALMDEAEDVIPSERLLAVSDLFDLDALSAAIARSRVADVPGCEGVVYDLICEGGSADLDLFNAVVLRDVGYTYMDRFADALWNGV